MTTETETDAPDIDAMIGASSAPAAAVASTALDDLAQDLAGQLPALESPTAPNVAPGGSQDEPDALERPRRSHKRGEGNGRPRGRPPKDPGVAQARGTRADLAAQLAAQEAELAQARAEVERLRAATNESAVAELANQVKLITFATFGVVAFWTERPHWQATEQEADMFANATAISAAPYAAEIQAKLPWAAPAVTLGSMIVKRVMLDMELRRDADPSQLDAFTRDG